MISMKLYRNTLYKGVEMELHSNSRVSPMVNIVLVTKGRDTFLDPLLKSFDPYLLNPKVRILVINNGANQDISAKLDAWALKNSEVVTLVRWLTNHPEPSFFWEYIKRLSLEWCWFPSDDDELMPGFVDEFHRVYFSDPSLIAFSGTASAISSTGELLNEELVSPISNFHSCIDSMAAAFHECPFIWPATIFNIAELPLDISSSRYAFDWLVGLNSLAKGTIYFSKNLCLKYRRHKDQESAVVPLSRKFFESLIHLDSFIESPQFFAWAKKLSNDQRLEFFSGIINRGPIYGDPWAGQILIFQLFKLLKKIDESNSFNVASYHLMMGAKFGALLSENDLVHFGIEESQFNGQGIANYEFDFAEGTCNKLRETFPKSFSTQHAIKVYLGCPHSKKGILSRYVKIDCEILDSFSPLNVDKVKLTVVDQLIRDGILDYRLTSGERKIIILLRKIRPYVPKLFLKRLSRMRPSL
jgi:hypothetical protein